MPQWFRAFVVLALPLSILAACGGDRESASPMDTALDLTGVAADCPAGDISEDIAEIFPTKKSLRHVATVNCGQIFKDFGKGKQAEAIQKAFRFFLKTLQQYENDQLLDPDPSVEAKIVDLFTAIFAGIGSPLAEIDPQVLADGEYAIGTLIPGGPPLLTISGHAGIDDAGGLFGPVDVIIFQIFANESELTVSSASHPCPAGVDNSFDCYPLFFDYSVSPESNVNTAIGLQLGQCNVSPDGVEVLLLSPEGFLPEDDAPNGVVCDDVQPEEITMTGWRKYAWAVLEPISPLFRVTPAIAGKNPIGGRISAFSPVAPADPESGGEETLGSISGEVFDNSDESSIQGADVELFTSDEELVGSTTTNSDGNYFFSELNLGSYIVQAEAEGYSSASSDAVTLTEESPDADNVDIGLDPTLIGTATEISPDDANLVGPDAQQSYIAGVTEVPGGASVNGGTVTFTVTNGDNITGTFDADVVEGVAEVTVGCFSEAGEDIIVTTGNFTVTADYLGTATHAASSDPTPSTLSCTIIG